MNIREIHYDFIGKINEVCKFLQKNDEHLRDKDLLERKA